MKDLNIYIVKKFYDTYIIFKNKYNLENIIFNNIKVNINFTDEIIYTQEGLKKYDCLIKHNPNYKKETIEIMYKNMVFINTFLKYDILENKNTLIDDIKLFPYTFYLYDFNKKIIKNKIKEYNNLYNGNMINTDYGIEYWIVKENYNNRGIGTFLCKTEDLYKIKKKDIIIQKYLEIPSLIDKKKYDIRMYLFIIPKVIYKDDKYQLLYKNNKLVLNYYIHNIMLYKYSLNIYDINDKDIKTHLTNTYIQNTKNYYFIDNNDNDIKKNIKSKIISYLSNDITQKYIYKSINKYPFFYQIIGIDSIISKNKQIYIVDVNTKSSLHYEEINDTYLNIACLQRVFRTIYKLKYNRKYKINKKIKNYLEKIKFIE